MHINTFRFVCAGWWVVWCVFACGVQHQQNLTCNNNIWRATKRYFKPHMEVKCVMSCMWIRHVTHIWQALVSRCLHSFGWWFWEIIKDGREREQKRCLAQSRDILPATNCITLQHPATHCNKLPEFCAGAFVKSSFGLRSILRFRGWHPSFCNLK